MGVAAAALLAAAVSERVSDGWNDPEWWLPDLLTGAGVAICGLLAWRRSVGTGALLIGSSVAWFAANGLPEVVLLHRALLVHAIVCLPGWRPGSWLRALPIGAAYLVAVVAPIGNQVGAIAVLAVWVVVVCGGTAAKAPLRMRRAALAGLMSASVFAVPTAVIALQRSGSAGSVPEFSVWLYEAAFVASAAILAFGLRSDHRATLDLVVELGDDRSGTLRDGLALAIGDPSLDVGYWDGERYVDVNGLWVDADRASGERLATFIDREGARFVVVVHDVAALRDPALAEAVATATRLSNDHAELLRVVSRQRAELDASRRRLMTAADDERRSLDDMLRRGAEQRLSQLGELVEPIEASRCSRLDRVLALLDASVDDLRRLAAGLHPRIVDLGIRPALAELAAACPVPVHVRMDESVIDDHHRVTLYYLCAEALSNAVKHAACSSVVIEVSATSESTRVVITDDGAGGIDLRHGTGLRGIVDRIESVGGRIRVVSDINQGSRITAELPVEHDTGETIPETRPLGRDDPGELSSAQHAAPGSDGQSDSPEKAWT